MVYISGPASRGDFYIAIICALPREADAIMLLFDQFWDHDEDIYGRADGDTNTYITGRIGKYDVVLIILPNMGTTAAAAAVANFRSSYTSLKLAFLVGSCGGLPKIAGDDAFLGDVVVSKTIIQYDYGRQYQGVFEVKKTIEDSLGRANKDIRSFLATFETEFGRELLETKAKQHLGRLQSAALKKRRHANYRYPGPAEDKLFQASYTHKHRVSCGLCASVNFCESASKLNCTDLGCDEVHLVARERHFPDLEYTPKIFIGHIGSGNTVMKSGKDRDRIAAAHNIIAFEMEGAGAWDEVPCIVIKGICDYADSHKNKKWQDFAAATAASVMRAMLERYILNDSARSSRRGGDQMPGIQARNSHNATNAIMTRDELASELHAAVQTSNMGRVRNLLQSGADIEAPSKEGDRCLLLATFRRDMKMIRLLVENGADIDAFNNGWTPMHEAVKQRNTDTLRVLLNHKPDLSIKDAWGHSPLHLAAMSTTEILKMLLENAPDIENRTLGGETPLHITSVQGEHSPGPGTFRECAMNAKALLELGADVNALTIKEGRTALHKAAKSGNEALTRVLLEFGADRDILDAWGNTATGQEGVGESMIQLVHGW